MNISEHIMYFVAPRQNLELSQQQILSEICCLTLQAYQQTQNHKALEIWQQQSYGKVILQAKNHSQVETLSQTYPYSPHKFIVIPPTTKIERPQELNKMNLLTTFRAQESTIPAANIETIQRLKNKYQYVAFINQKLGMQQGKTAAQCAHAYLEIIRQEQPHLLEYKQHITPTVAFMLADTLEWQKITSHAKSLTITDQGRTEIAPGSQTVCIINNKYL